MTEATLDQVNELKRAHAREILAATEALQALIDQKPDLWFGGLPPPFINLRNMIGTQTRTIAADFGLGETAPAAATPAPTTAA